MQVAYAASFFEWFVFVIKDLSIYLSICKPILSIGGVIGCTVVGHVIGCIIGSVCHLMAVMGHVVGY